VGAAVEAGIAFERKQQLDRAGAVADNRGHQLALGEPGMPQRIGTPVGQNF